jgi:hypothetical protein
LIGSPEDVLTILSSAIHYRSLNERRSDPATWSISFSRSAGPETEIVSKRSSNDMDIVYETVDPVGESLDRI